MFGLSRSRSLFPALTAILLTLVASPALGQDQEGMLEFEVVSVDPSSFMVQAREISSGREIQFRLPAQAFRGKRFDAEVDGVEPGERFSARGAPNSRVLGEAPRGWEQREEAPGRVSAPGREGRGDYQVARVSGEEDGFVVVARASGGRSLTFRIAASAFEGYRFLVDPESIAQGRGLELVAPNRNALRDCCTLLPSGG